VWDLDPNDVDYFQNKFNAFEGVVKRLQAHTCLLPRTPLNPEQGQIDFEGLKPGAPIAIDEQRHLIVLSINSAIRCGERNQTSLDEITADIKRLQGLLVRSSGADQEALNRLQAWCRERCLFDVPSVTSVQRDKIRTALERTKREHGAIWQQSLR